MQEPPHYPVQGGHHFCSVFCPIGFLAVMCYLFLFFVVVFLSRKIESSLEQGPRLFCSLLVHQAPGATPGNTAGALQIICCAFLQLINVIFSLSLKTHTIQATEIESGNV